MNPLTLQVSHTCAYTLNSLPRPQSCSRDIGDGLWARRWVAAQKPPQSASGRRNQPAGGDPESNRGCPGPRDIKRDGHNRLETSVKPALLISTRAKVQSTLGQRSQPRPVRNVQSSAVLALCCARENLHRHFDRSILPTTSSASCGASVSWFSRRWLQHYQQRCFLKMLDQENRQYLNLVFGSFHKKRKR